MTLNKITKKIFSQIIYLDIHEAGWITSSITPSMNPKTVDSRCPSPSGLLSKKALPSMFQAANDSVSVKGITRMEWWPKWWYEMRACFQLHSFFGSLCMCCSMFAHYMILLKDYDFTKVLSWNIFILEQNSRNQESFLP